MYDFTNPENSKNFIRGFVDSLDEAVENTIAVIKSAEELLLSEELKMGHPGYHQIERLISVEREHLHGLHDVRSGFIDELIWLERD